MIDTNVHIDPMTVPESPATLLMHSIAGMMHERDVEVHQLKQERDYYKEQVQTLPQTSIVADGKQNEIIAVLNVLYEYGMVTCSKKEFMQRMAEALGAPSIADYSRQLNKVKQTYKYEELFDRLKETALSERYKND